MAAHAILLRKTQETCDWTLRNPRPNGFAGARQDGVLEEKAFTKRLDELRIEMKEKAGEEERIEYWSFVRTSNFPQTVLRAQMVSFLISYGMAVLERKREKMFLIPRDPPFASRQGSPLSYPIPITKEVVTSRAK